MAEWRLGRGWTAAERQQRLAAAEHLGPNFSLKAGLRPERGWGRHYSQAVIAREAPGPPEPDGPFERAWPLVRDYAFSDTRIVKGHFDRRTQLLGRRLLLEIRVLGLHYLCAAVVAAVRDEADERCTVRGFRYDTLEGHVERGCEWFLLRKDHGTGEVTFTIRAAWRPGDFPNAWSRIGFRLLARRYQRAWHRLAHLRLRRMLGSEGLRPLPRADRLVQEDQLVQEGPSLTVAAVQFAAAGKPHPEITAEHDEPAVFTHGDEMTELLNAAAFGFVSGSRTMLAPLLVSQSFAVSSPLLEGSGPAADLLTRSRVVQWLPILAAGEILADKLPLVPPRTQVAPVLGRMGSGALVGAAIASPDNRRAAAILGAAGALAGTLTWYHLRRLATQRGGVPNVVAGLCEDALAIGLGAWLLRRARHQ